MERMLRVKKREECPYKAPGSEGCIASGKTCILDEKREFIDGLPQPHKMPCVLEMAPASKETILDALNRPNPFSPLMDETNTNPELLELVVSFWKKGVMWASNIYPIREE